MPSPNMYELYDNGKLDGIYRSSDIEKKLGVSHSYLYRCAEEGYVIQKRYLIKKSELTYQEAMKLERMQPEIKPAAIKTVKTEVPCVKNRHMESAGRTFMLPDWNKIEKMRGKS